MFRNLFIAVVCFVNLCAAAALARAEAIPMAYDDTDSAILSDCTFETGSPAVGSFDLYGQGAIVASDSGGTVLPNEGEQFLKLASYKKTWIGYGSTPTGDAMTVSFALQLLDGNSVGYIYFGTTKGGTDVASFQFNGDGTITAGGGTLADVAHSIGEWNDVVLTHANGNSIWNISVNGSEPVDVTMTLSSRNAAPVGHLFKADSGATVYVDASLVPEPASLALLAAALIGLAAARARKKLR